MMAMMMVMVFVTQSYCPMVAVGSSPLHDFDSMSMRLPWPSTCSDNLLMDAMAEYSVSASTRLSGREDQSELPTQTNSDAMRP